MSLKIDEDIKRWTAKRKSALVVDIIQGRTTVAEASRAYGFSPAEVEKWVDDAQAGHGKCPQSQIRRYPRAI